MSVTSRRRLGERVEDDDRHGEQTGAMKAHATQPRDLTGSLPADDAAAE